MSRASFKDTMFTGAVKLLQNCLLVTSKTGIGCTVMGGWNALLYMRPDQAHPRTFDVDLLLPPKLQRSQAEALIQGFLNEGYSQSAKHAFQLIKTMPLGAQDFAFNVDLLHPFLESRYPEMFLDLMEYGVPMSDFDKKTMNFSKSIVMPGIDEVVWRRRGKRTLVLSDGDSTQSIEAIFPDPVAFVCSKALALGGSKRPRDAYDIFLTLHGQGSQACADDLYELAKKSPTARRCLENLRAFMREEKGEDGRKREFVSSFKRNEFFRILPPETQSSCVTEAKKVVGEFIEATDKYPEGMETYASQT